MNNFTLFKKTCKRLLVKDQTNLNNNVHFCVYINMQYIQISSDQAKRLLFQLGSLERM